MTLDHHAFFAGYRANFERHLSQSQVSGLEYLLGRLSASSMNADVRWIAYALATVKRETANTFQPIEEVGRGHGHDYGKSISGHAYYGRGYVQLTWKQNYQKFTPITGCDLVFQPQLALRPDVAFSILNVGMREGLFTGKKLADYIHGTHCDYLNARRIINGMDRAALIAGYASKLEHILKASML